MPPNRPAIHPELLTLAERDYLDAVLKKGRFPAIEELWLLMDAAWVECGCDLSPAGERLAAFYAHPVWLLNGLFVEQHDESLRYRQAFTRYVAGLAPRRIADFGGGYGTLARLLGAACPGALVEVIEPHPHALAISLAKQTENVCYVPELSGDYDVILATDVFEHVPDPLLLVENTAEHLTMGGRYLMANCFWPVTLCHLPETFHWRCSWDAAMTRMNLKPGAKVSYGRSYQKTGPVSAEPARAVERRSLRWIRLLKRMPPQLQGFWWRLLLLGLQPVGQSGVQK